MTGQRLIASIELRAALIAGRIYTEWATGTVADRLEAAAQYDGGYHDGYGVLSAEDRAGLLSLLLELESAGLSDATSRRHVTTASAEGRTGPPPHSPTTGVQLSAARH